MREEDRTKHIKERIILMFSDERNVLIALLLIGILFWSFHINSPLLDHHSWRQTDTAAIARNFYNNGFHLFHPQIDWGGSGPGYAETEFQLVPFIIAVLYKIFGVNEWVARLVVIAFSLGSIYLLYMLARTYFDIKTSIFSVLIFIFSPLELYFGQAVMPDSAMIFFSIGSLYFFDKWIKKQEGRLFAIAAICTTLALLLKISALYLGLPLLWLSYSKYGKKLIVEPRFYLFAILTLIPPAIWYYYAHASFAQYATFGIWEIGSGKWGNTEIWFDREFYIMMLNRMATVVFTPLGLILFIYGLSLKSKLRTNLFYFWVLAILIYFMAVANGNFAHDYYQRPLVPPGAIFVGLALSRIYEKNNRVSLGLTAIILVSAIYTATPFFAEDTLILNAAITTDKMVEKSALIITTESEVGANPEILYYSQRKGWTVPGMSWSPAMIDSLKAQGADYLVVAPQLLLLNNTKFSNYLFNTYRSVIGSYFVIFDLHKPSDILSFSNQTNMNFKGKGALIGGYIAEPGNDGILNVTSYYRLTDNASKYYVLTMNFINNNGESLLQEPFLTNELMPGVIMKNHYSLLLPDKVETMVRDIQFEVHELDVQKLLSTWAIP